LGRRLARLTGKVEQRLWPGSPVVLMYHRVAEPRTDLWGLAVGPERFAEQVEALGRVRRIVPLGELVRRAREGRAGSQPLAAITFDDGYHDAYTAARPILERLDAPATVYVCTGQIGAGREFWWDELAHILVERPRLPPRLTLEFPGGRRSWTVGEGPAEREQLCRQVRRRLRDLRPDRIDEQLEAMSAWAGLKRGVRPDHRAMTADEVARLDSRLVTVGAHTVRHPSLPHLARAEQAAEIEASREACQAMTGAAVEHFAYPFGHYDGRSLAAARAAGFVSACATTPGVVRPWTDPFRLPRLAPGRCDGEALQRRLAGH
jgi:peptidoglycan/xylan/chitin deacetylase (PgdA/CDA1 family)